MNDLKEKIIEFLKKNPKPTDEKFHKFIEGMGLGPGEGEAVAYSILGEILTSGKSKGKTSKVNPKELAMGIKVEAEHTGNKEIAKKIARDHLAEFSNYYSKLLAMEKDMKKTKKFIKIFDNLFIKMEKAKTTKYIKRIKKPSGKGYIYFYTKEEFNKYKESPHKPEKEKSKEPLKKASIMKLNGKYYRMDKAKKMPIGTISNGKKKVAEGKWVPVGTDKIKPKKKPDEKKDKKKKELTSDENTVKEKMKVALKKIATILADALSGKEVVQPTGSGIEEVGERIKQKKKPAEKKDEPKGKK